MQEQPGTKQGCPSFLRELILVKDKREKTPLSSRTSDEQVTDLRIAWKPRRNAAPAQLCITRKLLWLDDPKGLFPPGSLIL